VFPIAALVLAAACGKDSGQSTELEKLAKKKQEEAEKLAKVTAPKPPEPARPPPKKEDLVASCKADRDAVACQGACAMDDWESCNTMAVLYEEGTGGVPVDFDAARRFHLRACDGGSGPGCYDLANFYVMGKDVGKNPRKAQEYFKKACDLKVEAACKELEPR
jgi:hypothetical protein